jgi:hypothetical protein
MPVIVGTFIYVRAKIAAHTCAPTIAIAENAAEKILSDLEETG